MPKVLILDNEAGRLTAFADILSNAGMQVAVEECVISTLEHAERDSIDLILAAERLPGLDALDLLELRQGEKRLHEVPVVVIAGSARSKLECYRLGCDEFITLPMDDAEILFRIVAVLRRAPKKGMHGSFEHITLVDLIQLISSARRSGLLTVECGLGKGVIAFDEGQVVHAEQGEHSGEGAVLMLLRSANKGGAFQFTAGDHDQSVRTIEKRTDHLLLELANLIDEESDA